MQVRSLSWEDPLEEGIQPIPIFLPGESYRQRSLVVYSPWGRKESDMAEATEHSTAPCILERIFRANLICALQTDCVFFFMIRRRFSSVIYFIHSRVYMVEARGCG